MKKLSVAAKKKKAALAKKKKLAVMKKKKVVMAKKKAGGSTTQHKSRAGKRLGIKIFGGGAVKTGQIIVRQHGTKFHPGESVRRGPRAVRPSRCGRQAGDLPPDRRCRTRR